MVESNRQVGMEHQQWNGQQQYDALQQQNKQVQQMSNFNRRRPSTGTGRIAKAAKRTDTGVFWDEPLDLYLGGAININLYNNVIGMTSGDTISGTIDIEIEEQFDATELVIEFKGVERSHLKAPSELKDYHREVAEIISMMQTVVEFPAGQIL